MNPWSIELGDSLLLVKWDSSILDPRHLRTQALENYLRCANDPAFPPESLSRPSFSGLPQRNNQ